MNFVFVGTSAGARGTETHLVCMVRALVRAGHTVLTVARPSGYIARELTASGLPMEPGIFRNAADVRGAGGVLRAIQRVKADWLVGSFGHEYWPLLTLGKLTGTPVALFRHLNSRLKPMSRVLLPRWADRFIAVSEAMRAHLMEQGVPQERVQLLFNPLEVERFRPDPRSRAESRRMLGVKDGEVLVGFVGSISVAKGAFMLAEALNQAMRSRPRLRALWVGEEAAHARLREAIAPELRERHVLREWTPDVVPLYAAMDTVAIPSRVLESFGRVSIEAQACGVPVLASRQGGLPETLLEGDTGLLLPPEDVDAWRDALVATTDMSLERRRAMGEAGMRFVRERFSTERIVEEFIDLLRTPPGREN
jgi:glycosyltransferase involved in cell wall biosynthesis